MSKTPPKISEDTELTMNLKTISILVSVVVAIVVGYYNIKNKDEDKDEVLTKVEFKISQEAVKQIVTEVAKDNRKETDQIVRETQGHIRDGHTTMYQMILENTRKEIIEAKKEIIQQIADAKKEILQEIRRTK
jgi:hypothetical protein